MSRRPIIATLAAAAALAVPTALGVQGAGATSTRHASASQATAPYENPNLSVRKRVADLLSRMTLEEKIGQMTQAERARRRPDTTRRSPRDKLGSVLSGGGSVPTAEHARRRGPTWSTATRQAALATRLRIPILYGIDTVHGDGNMYGATVFPHNIGLGATRDPALVQQVEHIAAEETRATGPQWAFAPCICAARDDRWGRTYESFGEDPKLVEQDGDRDRRLPGQGRQGHRQARPRARHRQALRGRRPHHLRHRLQQPADRRLPDRPGRRPGQPRHVLQARPAPVRAGDPGPQRRLASCRPTRASTGPRTASATRSTCTATRS